jgi:hypothetical protein
MLVIIAMFLVGALGAMSVPKAKVTTWNFHLYGKASLGWSFLKGQENGKSNYSSLSGRHGKSDSYE